MQCITKLASPNCLFLGILPVSIFIWALFNCLIVILNLLIFNLPQACRNVNSALEDHLTEDSFPARLTSHIAACKIFSPGCENFGLWLCQFQPDPGRWQLKPCGKTGAMAERLRCRGGCASPSSRFPFRQQHTLLGVPSPPCTDHFSA